MAADPLRDLAARLDRLAKDLNGPQMKRIVTDLGVAGKKDIDSAVRADLGDASFSNWRRGRPIQIGGRFDETGPTSLTFTPAKRAAGPMRVLTEGRKAGMSGGRKRGGRVGATSGRGTWNDATADIEAKTPRRALDAIEQMARKAIL